MPKFRAMVVTGLSLVPFARPACRSASALEVLPSVGLKPIDLPCRVYQPHPGRSRRAPNPCDRDALYLRRNRPRRRKQQFIVVPAVQRVLEPGKLPLPASHARPRNRIHLDFGPYMTLFANMLQIRRKPVADVDHG